MSHELRRNGCWKTYLQYQKSLGKRSKNSHRLQFLNECKKANIIPNFLKFRIPGNGCFDDKTVHEFQLKLLRKEIFSARSDLAANIKQLSEKRNAIKMQVSRSLLPSIVLYTRISTNAISRKQVLLHRKKLAALSEEQERPLFSVQNTVIQCELDRPLPTHVINTLSLGPKSSVLDAFNPKDVLSQVDGLLYYCKSKQVSNDTINDINVKALNYIKKCKKLKSSRNIILCKKYLKDNQLLAVPFDKGIGICVMKQDAYHSKLDAILQLPQFEKVTSTRKNAKHPVLKEQDRILRALKEMKEDGRISEGLYEKLRPTGSQPPRLYGLAKIHKTVIPVRPVLSMPGSAYYKIGNEIAEWLATVPECKINSSTKMVNEQLKSVHLEDDEEIISFDVVSLYTNVPVLEAINVCADLLYRSGMKTPPVDKDTFIQLATIASCNVVMSTHDGYYQQIDGLAMGSPPAPHLANGWMSQYDQIIQGEAKLYTRYMDDILREIKHANADQKLAEINALHPNLAFTIERETEGRLPFLDMQVIHSGPQVSSTWYSKPTDTGLILNFHALAPMRYKRSVISGFVHRIFRACSTWKHFHASIQKAKSILEQNQYPPSVYESIIKQTLDEIITSESGDEQSESSENQTVPQSPDTADTTSTTEIPKHPIFIQYRGKGTEEFAQSLHNIKAPCTVIMTLRKLKTVLPSLKAPVEKHLRSGVVYKIECARCQAAYVGQTSRHLLTRMKEHQKAPSPVAIHMQECGSTFSLEDTTILDYTTRGESHLLTLEALWIQEMTPSLNTQEDFRNRTLTVKFF